MKLDKLLYILRNPYGYSEDVVRSARQQAADIIEEFLGEISRNKEVEDKVIIFSGKTEDLPNNPDSISPSLPFTLSPLTSNKENTDLGEPLTVEELEAIIEKEKELQRDLTDKEIKDLREELAEMSERINQELIKKDPSSPITDPYP